jgi:hypothetical protein
LCIAAGQEKQDWGGRQLDQLDAGADGFVMNVIVTPVASQTCIPLGTER